MFADLVLLHGQIYTLDPAHPRATALAVHGERIIAVGDDAMIQGLVDRTTGVINLAGHTVIPGLVDGHIHCLWHALGQQRVDLDNARSLDEVLGRLAARLAQDRSSDWLLGHGWNHNEWQTPVLPDRHSLDRLAPERPLLLSRKDGHIIWVNSRALALAGISHETPDPPGGQIDRDAAGEPTGILRENANDLVWNVVPQPGREAQLQALRQFLPQAARLGLTGIHDCEGSDALAAFQSLHSRGELTLRVMLHIPHENLDAAIQMGIRDGLGDAWVRLMGIKLFADGALGGQTAAMLADYEGKPGDRGILTLPREEMAAAIEKASAAGLSCAIHAIGDAANRQVLDLYEAQRREHPERLLRHRIEHVQLLHPDDLPRLARLNVIASMQPIHATSDRYIAERWWGSRARYAYAWRSLLNRGTVLAFGSDAPVETPDPLRGLYAAVTRKRENEPDVPPFYPEEALTLHEALWAYTVGAACASGEEAIKGTLTPGKLADLVVLDRDIMVGPPETLLQAQVEMTLVGGRVVYRRPGLSA